MGKRVSARAALEQAWAQAVQFVVAQGAGGGVIRALRAHAVADIAETVDTIEDAQSCDLHRGNALALAWRAWVGEYALCEVRRLLPELQRRWPTKEERHHLNASRQKHARWLDDGVRIVEAASAAYTDRSDLRVALGLRGKRFDVLLVSLKAIGAVRARADGALLGIAPAHWVREKMHALSPSL